MSKAWYYEMMGAELGPISTAELIDKAKKGQIQPDTRVRCGKDSKWQFAERVKGLFGAPPAPEKPVFEKPMAPVAPPPVPIVDTIPLAGSRPRSDEDDATYHFSGDSGSQGAETDSDQEEYEFFKFIGFSQAISQPLYDVLLDYSRKHNLTLTQVTRQALAKFLGRNDLAEPSPKEAGSTPSEQS